MSYDVETYAVASLDDAVYAAIRAGADTSWKIRTAVREAIEREGGDTYRLLDRVLQRLRKAGRVEFTGSPRRWKLSTKQEKQKTRAVVVQELADRYCCAITTREDIETMIGRAYDFGRYGVVAEMSLSQDEDARHFQRGQEAKQKSIIELLKRWSDMSDVGYGKDLYRAVAEAMERGDTGVWPPMGRRK